LNANWSPPETEAAFSLLSGDQWAAKQAGRGEKCLCVWAIVPAVCQSGTTTTTTSTRDEWRSRRRLLLEQGLSTTSRARGVFCFQRRPETDHRCQWSVVSGQWSVAADNWPSAACSSNRGWPEESTRQTLRNNEFFERRPLVVFINMSALGRPVWSQSHVFISFPPRT